MKKFLKIFLISLLTVVAFSVLAVVMLLVMSSHSSEKLKETSTTVTTTAFTTTTEAPTETSLQTTADTTKPVPVTTTQPTTFIDINSLSIIDLYPLSLSGGNQDVKHCQGITVDKDNGYMYYSYTTMLIKCDFDGNVVASVTGIDGHLGDITYNKADKKIYCGYYATGRTGFYVYIFDTTKITKMNMKPTKDIVRSVYVKEAYEDYLASWKVKEKDGTEKTMNHRFNCSGIDGVTMGPDFSKKETKKEYLTVAYGLYNDENRKDSDYQVLLQYDVTGWWDNYGREYSKTPHRSGPEKCNKYFVYTGNTTWGVQTMEYFDELNIWVLNCYAGIKEKYNKYTLFAVDGDFAPKEKNLKGQYKTTKGQVLTLYTEGEHDKKNGIWGYYSRYGVQGIAYMGDGLFYVCQPYKAWTGTKLAICYLNVWKADKTGKGPFVLCVDVDNDYKIKKSKHVNEKKTVTTTAPNKTNKEQQNGIGQIFQQIF